MKGFVIIDGLAFYYTARHPIIMKGTSQIERSLNQKGRQYVRGTPKMRWQLVFEGLTENELDKLRHIYSLDESLSFVDSDGEEYTVLCATREFAPREEGEDYYVVDFEIEEV